MTPVSGETGVRSWSRRPDRTPRHHHQSFAQPKGGREKGTRNTQAHQPKRTTQTTQKLQAQHNHPHKRGWNPPRTATTAQPHGQGRTAKATTTQHQEGREGQERRGRGKGNAGAKKNKVKPPRKPTRASRIKHAREKRRACERVRVRESACARASRDPEKETKEVREKNQTQARRLVQERR